MRAARLVATGLVVGLGLLLTACKDSDEAEAYPTTPFEREALEELHEIRDEISALRELPLNPDSEEGWISSRDYRKYVEREFEQIGEDDLEAVELADTVLKLLGILQPDDSYYDQALDIQSNYVAGFYSFETDQLVLVGGGGKLSKFERSTLAHEYVHSFQEALTEEHEWERRFSRSDEKKALPHPPSYDYAATLSCVLEGDAEYSEALFDDRAVEKWDDYVEHMSWIERNVYFPYSVCLEFIESIHARGGWDSVNDLYEDPPKSIEQVIHPEKFHAKEPPSDLFSADISTDLGDGWQRSTADAVYNEFDVWNYILAVTDDVELADRAAEGWGMGWINIYSNLDGDMVIGHISLQFDSPKDYEEFESAFDEMLDVLGREGDQQWANTIGSGHASWDSRNRRVDIVVGTDAGSIGAAVYALGYERPDIASKSRRP